MRALRGARGPQQRPLPARLHRLRWGGQVLFRAGGPQWLHFRFDGLLCARGLGGWAGWRLLPELSQTACRECSAPAASPFLVLKELAVRHG